MIWAAATATAAPHQNAEPPCPAGRILVEHVAVDPVPVIAPFGWSADAKAQALLVSKIVEPDNIAPGHGILPKGKSRSKGPAVLMPGCKSAEERKKKDYPMA
jgi:hypothetical protein